MEDGTRRQIDDTPASALGIPTDATASTIAGGQAYVADLARRLAPYCARSQSRDRGLAYLRGWLREAERKHSWHVAEVCGESTPYGLQYLLSRADGDADAVRDELHTSSRPPLGDPNGVLVLDDTGLLQKGRHSAGVARPYRGTVGNVDHGPIGVCLSDASPLGDALLDRALDRPQAWTDDGARCRQAALPEDRRVATTPPLAQPRLARAFAAGVPAAWGTGDRVYGEHRPLRRWLEAPPPAYGRAVSGTEEGGRGAPPRQVKALLASVPVEGWTRLGAGDGAKGPRWYDWRWGALADPVDPTWRRWWLVRRRLSAPADLTAQVVFAPPPTMLEDVGRVAGRRWPVESGVAVAKGEVGLDQSEVRSWRGWDRHLTLVMWALARLTVMRAGTIAVDM